MVDSGTDTNYPYPYLVAGKTTGCVFPSGIDGKTDETRIINFCQKLQSAIFGY
jgi:hypothetical protein